MAPSPLFTQLPLIKGADPPHLSLIPSPFSRVERKGPGIHCLRMSKIFLEFQERVFFCNNAIWRWSSIAQVRYALVGVATPESYGQLLLKSVSALLFLLLYCRQTWAVSYISEEGTALSNLVPWKEYMLPVSTFPDGLQALGRWGRMY